MTVENLLATIAAGEELPVDLRMKAIEILLDNGWNLESELRTDYTAEVHLGDDSEPDDEDGPS